MVLDRATYYTVLDDEDRPPVLSWMKNRLIACIKHHRGAPYDWPLTSARLKTKMKLLQEARRIYKSPNYKIQKIADEFSTKDFNIRFYFFQLRIRN